MCSAALSNIRSAFGVLHPARPSLTELALDLGWLQAEFATDGLDLLGLADKAAPTPGHLLIAERNGLTAFTAEAGAKADALLVGITATQERQLLLARPGWRPIGPDALKGARLALISLADTPRRRRTEAMKAYIAALDRAGLTIDEVDIVSLPPAGLSPAEALIAGQVDIIHASGLEAIELRRRYGLEVVFDLGLDIITRALTAPGELVRDRPNLVARSLAVLLLVADWSIDNAAEVRRRIAVRRGVDPADVVEAHGAQFHLKLGLSLSPEAIARLEAHRDFLRDWALVPGEIDLAARLERGPLDEAQKLFRRGQVLANLKEAV